MISEKDIAQTAAFRVDDLFKELPGIYVRSYQGIMSSSTTNDISMRGMTGENRILVLRDGIPINDAYGGAVEWNEVNVDDLKKIEIVRGPGSALYGSNAMAGVVNMITKKPPEKMETSIKAGYGEMNTQQLAAKNSASFGRFGYSLSGAYLSTDGYSDIPESKRKSYHTERALDRANFDGKMTYDVDDSSLLSLLFGLYDQQTTGAYTIPGYEVNNDSNRLGLNYRREGKGWNLTGTLYRTEDNSDYTSPNSTYSAVSYISANSQENYGANLQGTMEIFSGHSLTVGSDFKQGEIDRHDDYKQTVRTITVEGQQRYEALYAQDEMTFGENWHVVLGGRYDWWTSSDGSGSDNTAKVKETDYPEKSDGAFNPKLGVNYRLFQSTTLRGAVGTAFLAPTLSDLYRTYATTTTVYQNNPDLTPETSISYEAGVDQRLGDKIMVRTTLYQTDSEDFVSNIFREKIGSVSYYDKRNVGEVRIQGVEVEGRMRLDNQWSFFATATYNESKIKEYVENPSLEDKYLAKSPKDIYGFGVVYDNPDLFTAKLSGRYVGIRYNDDANTTELDSYCTADLKLSRQIGKNLVAALTIDNLTDEVYEEVSGYQTPGRTTMLTLEMNF